MRFDGNHFQSAAGEDSAIGVVVLRVGSVEAVGVHIEGVRVLHDELPHAQQAGFRARLVAELGLDLVPDLRQLLVAAQLAARHGGHDFFVRHAKAKVAAETVLQPEHVVAHDVPAAGFLPELGGVESGQQKFLRADRIHLGADDLLDFQQGPLGEKEITVDARGHLADVAGAQQELVAGDLRFGRVLAQRGDEELAPEHNEGESSV